MRSIRRAIVVLIALAVTTVAGPRASRSDRGAGASPVAGNAARDPSVRLDVLGSQTMGGGQALWLARLVFAPGASLAFRVNPGATIARVEAGEVGFTVVLGTAWLRTSDQPSAPAQRADLATETVLGPGATASFGRDALHLFRNAGSVPASVLLTAVAPAGQPPYGQAVSTDGRPVGTSDA